MTVTAPPAAMLVTPASPASSASPASPATDPAATTPAQPALQRIGVIGSGTMGRGIAQVAAQAGLVVLLHDARPAAATDARAAIGQALQAQAAKGRVTPADAAATLARLVCVDTLDALADCDIVVEAIVENLAAKQSLFRALEALRSDHAILATNTSSLSVTAVASACRLPQRVVGWHFFNPVPLMRVAEVVPGLRTDPAVVATVVALTARLGHRAVQAQDVPGFIVNHAGRAFIPEGLRLLAEGVASVEDIDAVLRDTVGFRMGPFELADLVGLDNAQDVMQSMVLLHQHEPRFRITPLVATRVAAGLLGRKSGQGFYRYEGGRAVPAADTSDGADAGDASATSNRPPVRALPPVWIAPHEPDLADRACALLLAAGAAIEQGTVPSAQALIVITPVGWDVSTASAAWRLDATRTVALDALFSLDKRCTLMVAPNIAPAHRAAALAHFARTGRQVTLLRDSPGFIAQRMVAQIVCIACDMAQQRIAAPADIDVAVRLALAYPLGPFEFAAHIGPARVLQIAQALHDAYQEPRYRPSIWLRRRVQLGLPLHHGD